MVRSTIKTSKGIFTIEYDPTHVSGEKKEVYITCPICTPSREPQHQKEKKLAIRTQDPGDNKRWRCNHCGEGGYLGNEDYKKKEQQSLEIKELKKVPKFDALSEGMINWCKEHRHISYETLASLNVLATVKDMRKKNGEFAKGVQVLAFPSYGGETLVDIHYRSKNKLFSSEEGATKVFYNINALVGKKKGIITEGRLDTLAIYEAGVGIDAVSVPNGVSMSVAEVAYYKKTGEIDQSKPLNLTYLDLHWEVFDALEEVIIATDDDPPGVKLRLELARRIGQEKCRYIKWSDYDCKDANDCLIKHGKDGVKRAVKEAREFPVHGLIRAYDIKDKILHEYDNGKQKGLST
jgi:twinkle protein